jgi:hypothetical protein
MRLAFEHQKFKPYFWQNKEAQKNPLQEFI